MNLKATLLAIAAVAALTACGPGGSQSSGGGASPANNAACALLGDASAQFGANAVVTGYPGLDGMAATCEFASADGARGGDIITYTAQSLGNVTTEAKMAEIVQAWDGQTETPIGDIADLGEGGKIATGLPGYQTHIAFRKGATLVLIAARSGDRSITGEALARRMAAAAAADAS
jgi:hypothetical protein